MEQTPFKQLPKKRADATNLTLSLGSELATVPNGACTTRLEGICPRTGNRLSRSKKLHKNTANPTADITAARGPGLVRAAPDRQPFYSEIFFSHKRSAALLRAGLADDVPGAVAEAHTPTNSFNAILAATQLC